MSNFVSFVVPSLWNALGVPSAKLPIDGPTLLSYVLPPLVCHFVAAVLAVTPRTRTIRVALWPLVALLALRAALSVDMSQGRTERKFLNVDLVLFMLSVAARTLDWSLAEVPLVRHLHPTNTSSSSIIMDAFDLVSNIRGHGWESSRYQSYIPRETRPTDRKTFVFCTFLSAVAHTLICGALHRAIVMLAPVGVGSIPEGSTIFDESLPFLVQYLRASIISTLAALAIYAVLQMTYDLSTISAILILGHDPAHWPPVFDAPWCATSLNDFWGRRWHQLLRHTFLSLGGYPLSFILGRTGMVVGAFLASAVLHHIALVTLNSQMEMWWMLVGFGMMAPGILVERAFYHLMGKRVGGVLGWIWTMAWLTLWGNVIVEGFARAGMFSCASPVDSMLPVRIPVEHLMVEFDVWLRT
ncbi:hypothetical protein JVT61DRAFT_8964 [Boletus reticuloceps]|uniref:Wax synthase domain-containing protein n=1 Tax=Boletus reticuloceps TaxID=495285 RepID=A0A8I2YH99_9AGAM|nr:hypothetical protein JVT61DRAFT_8964 [Boletus reticuloceps]